MRWNGSPLLLAFSLFLAAHSPAEKPEGLKFTSIHPEAGTTTPGIKVAIYGYGFSPDVKVYFGGLQVREVEFVSPSRLNVVTPYLRPGGYQLQARSAEGATRSQLTFTSLRSTVDEEIDKAIALADGGQSPRGLATLSALAERSTDYQVRAFVRYQMAQIYFAEGDWWRWAGETGRIYDNSDSSGPAVQTWWRYRLATDEVEYFLPTGGDRGHVLEGADWTVKYDVTEAPEPRFFRGLINARFGNLRQANIDSDFALSQKPKDPLYRALAAYVAVLGNREEPVQLDFADGAGDSRALALIGEVAYLRGDTTEATELWQRAKTLSPRTVNLACWAGKKHAAMGRRDVAMSLLAECLVATPNTEQGKEAQDLLRSLQSTPPSPRY